MFENLVWFPFPSEYAEPVKLSVALRGEPVFLSVPIGIALPATLRVMAPELLGWSAYVNGMKGTTKTVRKASVSAILRLRALANSTVFSLPLRAWSKVYQCSVGGTHTFHTLFPQTASSMEAFNRLNSIPVFSCERFRTID
jgi:hypothetical protein